jgi:hypothetical protein
MLWKKTFSWLIMKREVELHVCGAAIAHMPFAPGFCYLAGIA